MKFRRRAPELPSEPEARTPVQIYLEGGGDPTDERTMALLAEAGRSRNGADAPTRGEP